MVSVSDRLSNRYVEDEPKHQGAYESRGLRGHGWWEPGCSAEPQEVLVHSRYLGPTWLDTTPYPLISMGNSKA